MNVLVDTSVWSLALRRTGVVGDPAKIELEQLVEDGRAAIIGPIREEILSGIRTATQFELLRNHLRAFPDILLTVEDYEQGARFFNSCRSRGIQGSNTDFLICAVAARLRIPILSTDADFRQYARVLPIKVHRY